MGRYQDVEDLGSGGMGDVRGVVDDQLGRVVAMKILKEEHAGNEELIERITREARVQGQLEHPAIVPVYDIGTVEDRPFFTMKRIRGLTLKQIIERQRAGDPEMTLRFSRRRLLNSFSSVLQAVDLAHKRGIVHRDLKPANVMFGDFGEVYVLDWGVAKFIDDDEPSPLSPPQPKDESAAKELTSTGELFGTPGYVAPEQLYGAKIEARTDIFALGAMLFELLCHEKMFPGDTAVDRVEATKAGTDVQGRAASHSIPPELAHICARAVAPEPADRYGSARELHDDLERFLDGERDFQRSAELARAHAERAAELAERAVTAFDPGLENRKQAMQNVSRSLALDPQNSTAVTAFVRLLTEPPTELPDAIRQRLDREAAANANNVLSGALRAHVVVLVLFTPLIWWLGVRDWTLFGVVVGVNLAVVAIDLIAARYMPNRRGTDVVFVSSLVWTGALSLLFGPYTVGPPVAVAATMAYLLVRRGRSAAQGAVLGCLSFAAPVGLQLAGVLPDSHVFSQTALSILPVVHGFPELQSHVFLLLSCSGAVAATAAIVHRFRTALAAAEKRAQLQMWQFRQLLPE